MDIRVVLADDHAAIRRALRQLLEIQANIAVIGEAKDGLSVVKLVGQLCPDIVVLDVSMPGVSSFDTVQQIRMASRRTQVIVLSMYLSRAHALAAMHAGASGYVLKESAGGELVNAIRTVREGNVYLSQALTQLVEESTKLAA